MKILAEISTKGRYHTTLPMCIQSIIMQTRVPDCLVIIDDNDMPTDLRENPLYLYLFNLLDQKGIKWEVLFGKKSGQHHNHQMAQEIEGYDLVWRIDDDEIAEPTCLEELVSSITKDVMAVGGLVVDPTNKEGLVANASSDSADIFDRPNIQWYLQGEREIEVEHLYSSFLYRPGVAKYNLDLSKVAHREETLFSMELAKKGKLIVNTKALTWHLRYPEGGIREGTSPELWHHDDEIFRSILKQKKN